MSGMVKRLHISFWNWVSMLLTASDQDALAAAAPDQLAQQDARLDGLAEAHRIGDQDALPGLLQRLDGRIELVGHDSPWPPGGRCRGSHPWAASAAAGSPCRAAMPGKSWTYPEPASSWQDRAPRWICSTSVEEDGFLISHQLRYAWR